MPLLRNSPSLAAVFNFDLKEFAQQNLSLDAQSIAHELMNARVRIRLDGVAEV